MILRPIHVATVSCCRTVAFIATAIAAVTANAQFASGQLEPPYELWKIDAAGGVPQRFAETPGYTCGSPDWSPDGNFIAYDTWRIGQTFSDSKIAVIRADGSGQKIIGEGGMPSWSPDGTQLTCHTYDNPQTIIVMNADGGGRETIINHWGSPRWLPRGNRIASLNTNGNIYLFDIPTGKESRVLPIKYPSNIGFGISSDGRQICFGDRDGGLFLATLDDRGQTAVRQLTKYLLIRHCSSSPDGKQIVFGGSSTVQEMIDIESERVKGEIYPREQLFVIDVDSTDPPKLLPGQDERRVNSCPDWSPDGKTIVFVSQVPRHEWETRMREEKNAIQRLRELETRMKDKNNAIR
jgi:Tol biopolymer transport system component